jgi:hypothetical protein
MRAALLLLAALPAVSLRAGPNEAYANLVHQVEAAYHVKPVHVPFQGLTGMAGAVATPFAMRSLKLAVFEDLPQDRKRLRLAPPGDGWQQAIRTESSDGERVAIYALPDRGRIRLLVVTDEEDEIVVIESEVSPAEFARQIRKETESGESN